MKQLLTAVALVTLTLCDPSLGWAGKRRVVTPADADFAGDNARLSFNLASLDARAPLGAPVSAPLAAPVAEPVPDPSLDAVPLVPSSLERSSARLAKASPRSRRSEALPSATGAQQALPAAILPAPSVNAGAATNVAASPAAARDPARDTTRFDLVVNNAPAAQVFLQLGAGSGFTVLVPPEVSGNVTLNLRGTNLPEALEALRELYGYDFRYSGSRVFVYPNTVQTRIFRVNYLPGRRQGDSSLRVSSTSISTNRSTPGTPGSTGSTLSSNPQGAGNVQGDNTAQVRTSSDADFWRDVQTSLTSMVGSADGRGVVLNAGSGVIVVRATPAELRHVGDYLKAVQLTIERQVMLEAKIIEVSLKTESQAGINWQLFRGNASGHKAGIGIVAPGATISGTGAISAPGVTINPGTSITTTALGKGFYGLAFQAANFSALLNFLETQGEVQVLSSPRIATLNNQKAVLKVGSDELYVVNVTAVQSVTTTGNTSNTSAVPTVELKPFFSGIVLDVTPQIDASGAIMLHVHPSISVVTERNKDLTLGLQGSYSLPLPVASISETDSIVRVMDRQIVAIGGLMTQQATSDRSGVPGVSEVPVFGNLFKQRDSTRFKRELVVLIKPTVIGDDGNGFEGDQPDPAMLKPQ